MLDPLWSVILAAGEGRRLAAVTGGLPKQFWAPPGGRTLLEDTVDRLSVLSPAARMVTVVNRSQKLHAEAITARMPIGRLAYQADDRGTAAGVLRGLTEVASDTSTIVLLTPSDHGIADPHEYRQGVRDAVRQVQSRRTDIVLFAVEPESPAEDFGWVLRTPASAAGELAAVEGFVEKPPASKAEELFASGAVWNTMVMVARVQSLLDLYRAHLPEFGAVLRRARSLPASLREEFLVDRYPSLPHADFSRDLVAPARGLSLYVWPGSMGWTDLGTPERLSAWMNRLTRRTLKANSVVRNTDRLVAAS